MQIGLTRKLSGFGRGVEAAGLTAIVFQQTRFPLRETMLVAAAGLSATIAVLSNLVSNVPAVVLYIPLLKAQGAGDNLWLLLAMASTLAGNRTIICSVANLIVLEASKDEVTISFLEYLRVGLPVTVLTIAAGLLMLQ